MWCGMLDVIVVTVGLVGWKFVWMEILITALRTLSAEIRVRARRLAGCSFGRVEILITALRTLRTGLQK